MTNAVTPFTFPKRRLRAAATLSAFYGISVAVLGVIYSLVIGYPYTFPHFLREVPALAGLLMVVPLLVLVLARRAGLALGWLLLLASWGVHVAGAIDPLRHLSVFASWTLLACPLYLITAIGIGPSSAVTPSPSRNWEAPAVLLVWLTVWITAYHYSYLDIDVGYPLGAPYGTARAVGTWLCAPLPFILGVRELLRIALTMRRE